MHARTLLTGFAAVFFIAVSAVGQGYWTKKPWQKWSKEDCQKMLQDSPWAYTWTKVGIVNTPIGQSSDGTGREQVPEIYYLVQLRSALPVRQAVVREAQLENKYDTMPADKKKVLDESGAQYLSRNYDNNIVVHLDYGSNVQLYERDMRQYWQSIPAGTAPVETYLISASGQKLVPSRMEIASGGENAVEFIFPRDVNDHPLIMPNDKSFSFQFMSPTIGTLAGERAYIEFRPRKMRINDQLVY